MHHLTTSTCEAKRDKKFRTALASFKISNEENKQFYT